MKKTAIMLLVSFLITINLKAQCELFTLNNYTFYNPQIYDHPILFEKGSHKLLQNLYIPEWYPGYCAIIRPSYFVSKNEYLSYIHTAQIEKFTLSYFDDLYETNKNKYGDIKRFFANDFFLLFRGTIKVKNITNGKEYLLVAGGDYISNESDFNKNTEFYEKYNKGLIAFALENGVYKLVDINLIFKDLSDVEYSKVSEIFSVDSLISAKCFENINNLNKGSFNNTILPSWVIDKSKK
ncbi:MAG TPA: hypothetical protein DCM02_04205 [Flavobacterium sp.]|nr:hypothetical protein [Flavobacterium sp.]HAT76201.1 hypothetical protein [Flavobacterium sp.]HAT81560.1 hypothetical protein [Flavobacterium sp.]